MSRPERVALFVPCYVDQLLPEVGLASADLLEAQGLHVSFPEAQSCCGQPFSNTGHGASAARLAGHFARVFAPFDAVVCPSASCVAMVRHTHRALIGGPGPAERTFELCEFLHLHLGVERLPGRFPHRVALHRSCHGLRGLRQGDASEGAPGGVDPLRALLSSLDGIELVAPTRDECCGFGGSFCVEEAAVSAAMGEDRLADLGAGGARLITSADASCLLHLDGLIRRRGLPLRVLHVAQVLAEALR